MEPHVIQPGYFKRWSKESLDLIVRSPVLWAIMLCAAFGLSQILRPTLYFFFLGGLLLNIFIILMALTDTQKITVSNFLMAIKIGSQSFYQSFFYNKTYLLFFSSVFIILEIYGFLNPSKLPTGNIISPFSHLCFTISFGYAFIYGGGGLKSFMPLLINKSNNPDVAMLEAMAQMCKKAAILNPKVASFLDNRVYMFIFISAIIFPYIGLLLILIVPAFIYVAYREMFEGISKNQVQKEIKTILASRLIC